jgi:xanthine/uracil permease
VRKEEAKKTNTKATSSAAQTMVGYLPDDRPPFGKMLIFALQQVIVMFPATVLVAIITGFDIGVTICASGLATLGFLLITGRRIPLYYGSSFSYIAAVGGVVATVVAATGSKTAGIQAAQAGIVASGLVSIVAGLLIKKSGPNAVKRVLPTAITGSIAIVIGLSLASTAMGDASKNWLVAGVTLIATILFSVYLKGTLGQLPVLFGYDVLALDLSGVVEPGGVESAGAIALGAQALDFALDGLAAHVGQFAVVLVAAHRNCVVGMSREVTLQRACHVGIPFRSGNFGGCIGGDRAAARQYSGKETDCDRSPFRHSSIITRPEEL